MFRQNASWKDEDLESLGPLDHLRQWELQYVLRVLRLPLDFLIVLWGELFTMIFIYILTTWRTCRNFLNVNAVLEATCERFYSKSFLRTLLFFNNEAHFHFCALCIRQAFAVTFDTNQTLHRHTLQEHQ